MRRVDVPDEERNAEPTNGGVNGNGKRPTDGNGRPPAPPKPTGARARPKEAAVKPPTTRARQPGVGARSQEAREARLQEARETREARLQEARETREARPQEAREARAREAGETREARPQETREARPQETREARPPEAREARAREAGAARELKPQEVREVRPQAVGPKPHKAQAAPAPRDVALIESPPWPLGALAKAAAACGVLVLVGALAAYLLAGLQPSRYEGRAELRYRLDSELGAGFLKQDRRLSTQIVAIESRAVLEPVAQRWVLDVEELSDVVSATVVGESEVIRIGVISSERERGAELALAVRSEYLAHANGPVDTAGRDRLAAYLGETADRRAQTAGSLAALASTDPRTTELRWEVERLRQLEVDLREELVGLDDELKRRQPATSLGDPYTATDPVSPRPRLAAMGGGLTGLVVGIVAVLGARQWLRRRALVGRPTPRP